MRLAHYQLVHWQKSTDLIMMNATFLLISIRPLPYTVSKYEGGGGRGGLARWPQARACFVSVERWKKRDWFDSWMVWRWVWWRVSSTDVNVCLSTRPEWLKDSHTYVSKALKLLAYGAWCGHFTKLFHLLPDDPEWYTFSTPHNNLGFNG